MAQINMYNNPISYLLGCVPLEYENNFEKAINLLESIIENVGYQEFLDYIHIFELDIKYYELIDRLYYRAICIERFDLITLFFDIKSKYIIGEQGNTKPLEIAVNNGSVRSLDLLIKLGYDGSILFGSRKQETFTALELACKKNNINLIKYLLDYGVDPNVSSCVDNGLSPLMYAARNNNYLVVKNLLKYGANPYYVNFVGECFEDSFASGKFDISKEDRDILEKISDSTLCIDEFIELIGNLKNKKVSNIKGSVLDIALERFGIETARKIYGYGFKTNYNLNNFLVSLISEYNRNNSDICEFVDLYNFIMLLLKDTNDKYICSASSVMLEYSMIKKINDEKKYIMLFEILRDKFILDYQKQMSDQALVRLAFRNKNIILMEYYVEKNMVPIEYSDGQNVFHDIVIFNSNVNESELDRICNVIQKLRDKNIDPIKEKDNCINPLKRAAFIENTSIREKIIYAMTS